MINTFRKIWAFGNARKKYFISAIAANIFRSLLGITQLYAIMTVTDAVFGKGGNTVAKLVILTAVSVAGNLAASYFEQTNAMKAGFLMTADKRISLGEMLRRVPLGVLGDISGGRITASMTTTLQGVETGATMSLISVVSGLFSSAAMFLFMIFYDVRIGLLTGAGIVCYLAVVAFQMKISQKNAPALTAAQSRLSDSILTFLQGIKVTKAFGFEKSGRDTEDAVDESCKANLKLTDISMPTQFLAYIVIAFFEAAIMLAAVYRCAVTGDITFSYAVMLIIFSFMVYASLNQAGSALSMTGMLDSAIDEITELEKCETLTEYEPIFPASGNKIVFSNVSFSYGENEVLKNISTVIKEGELTAVIGPSGSGKTTLCQLIPRFRDVSSGTVSIGGADVRHMRYEEIMARISMVFQRVYLFEDTVMNNIRFGKPDASDEEVYSAAKAARCDDFIRELPNGYDTVLSEGGSSLSGGEKQRISIARAILKDSPIIILDEATSALDAENEQKILSALGELTRGKTVIMIAHRINTIKNADHIIAVENGSIVQEGTHSELISQKGLYADFIAAREKAAGWKLERG